MEKRYFEISWNSLWRILAFILLLVALYLIRKILVLLVLAVIISSICQPFVDFLQKKKIPRLLGTLLVFILILGTLGSFLWLVIPLIVSQFGDFITNFNEIISKIGIPDFLGQVAQQLINNLKAAFDILASGTTTLFNFISSVFGGIFFTLTCLVLAFYLTLEEKGIEKFFRSILPKTYENQIISIFEKSKIKISRWFQGRLLLSLIIGLLSWLGLYLLGVKYSGTLALLVAVLDIIPLVGPIFAGLVIFLVALTNSWIVGFWAVLLFIIVQQLEGYLFAPLVMKKVAGLSPVVVLIALLVGAKIAGLLGLLLAIPAALVIQAIFEENVRRKTQV